MDEPALAIATGDIDAAYELKDWLDDVPELRGRSAVEVGTTPVGHQGAVSDVLVVALGGGGVVTVLAGVLKSWIAARQPSRMTVVVRDGKNEVRVEMDQTTQSAELAESILRAIDQPRRVRNGE